MGLVKNQLVLAKIEGTYRTDPTPTNVANAVRVENINVTPNAKMIVRNLIDGQLGTRKHINAGQIMQVTFDVELKGSGTAGTVPEYDPLIRACAYSQTTDPGVSNTYKPRSTSIESVTLWVYQDGTLTKINGCRGNMTINLTAGDRGMLSFDFMGHKDVNTSDAAVPTGTFQSTVPPSILSAGLQINGTARSLTSLTIDTGNTLQPDPSMNETNGYGAVLITGRDINGTIDPQHITVASDPWDQFFEDGTPFDIGTGNIGSPGNQFAITMVNCAFRSAGFGDRNGIITRNFTFGAAPSIADDDLQLVFS